MRNLALALIVGLAFFIPPTASHGQEIGAKEGDKIKAEASGKNDHVSVRSARPIRVEIVAPDPRPEGSYADWGVGKFVKDTFWDTTKQVTTKNYAVINEIPANGVFRVRVTYAKDPGVPNVPVTMLLGPPMVTQPFPFYAQFSDDAEVYMTPVIYLNAPIRDLMTMLATRGDEITADVEGVRDSATVVALPRNGVIPHRGYLRDIHNKKMIPTPFERNNLPRVPAKWEIDCSCKSVTLNRIVSRQYSHSSGLGIAENKLHYKNSVQFQLGDSSNPPERGTVVIPWNKERDIMMFYFTFPQSAAFIVRDKKHPICSAIVTIIYPHPRRATGNITEKTALYFMKGAGGFGTVSSNIFGRTTLRDLKQKGRGRISWGVSTEDCGGFPSASGNRLALKRPILHHGQIVPVCPERKRFRHVGSGFGLSRSMWRRMSANRSRGIATSASWKVT